MNVRVLYIGHVFTEEILVDCSNDGTLARRLPNYDNSNDRDGAATHRNPKPTRNNHPHFPMPNPRSLAFSRVLPTSVRTTLLSHTGER